MLVRFLFVAAVALLLALIALRLFAAPLVVGQNAGFLLAFLSTSCFFYSVAESKGLAIRPSSSELALVLVSASTTTIAIDHILLLKNVNVRLGMAIAISPLFLFFPCVGWWHVLRIPSNKSSMSGRIAITLAISLGALFVNLFLLKLGA